MIFFELFCLTIVLVYIVDLSGFIPSLRSGIAALLGVKETAVKLPLVSCSKCMTWWGCLCYVFFVSKHFNVYLVAYIALLSYLSVQLSGVLDVIREVIGYAIEWSFQKLELR